MLITETVTINEHEFKHTYSDAGYFIERDGISYGEAYDPYDIERVYTETSELIDPPTDEDYARAGRIMMGADDE